MCASVTEEHVDCASKIKGGATHISTGTRRKESPGRKDGRRKVLRQEHSLMHALESVWEKAWNNNKIK